MEFMTNYEQQKWNKLEQQARATFDKLKKGEGTATDLKRAQVLAAQYGAAAQQVFKAGVDAINKIAEERVNRIEEDRRRKGKSELNKESLLQLAVERAIKSEGVEIATTVEQIILDQLKAQDARLESIIDRKLRQFKTNIPDQDDLITALELANEQSNFQSYKRMEEASYRGMRRLIMEFRGVNGTEQVLEPETPKGNFTPSKLASDFVTDTKPLSMSQSSSPVLEEEKPNSVDDVLNNIKEKLEDIDDPNKQDKREERRSTSWWRKLKSMMGGAWDTVKSKARGIGLVGGLMALLGRFLLTELAGGKMMSKVKEVFDEYLTFDKIKDYGNQFLNWIGKQAKGLVSWIAEKLNISGLIDKVNPLHESDEDLVRKHSEAAETNRRGADHARSQAEMYRSMESQARSSGNTWAADMYRKKAEQEEQKVKDRTAAAEQHINEASAAQQRISERGSTSGNITINQAGANTTSQPGVAPTPSTILEQSKDSQNTFDTNEGGAAFGGTRSRRSRTRIEDKSMDPGKPVIAPDPLADKQDQVAAQLSSPSGSSILSINDITYGLSKDPTMMILNSASFQS